MKVQQIVEVCDSIAPPALAAEWDNVGLIVGRRARAVRRTLVALELRRSVVEPQGESLEHDLARQRVAIGMQTRGAQRYQLVAHFDPAAVQHRL